MLFVLDVGTTSLKAALFDRQGRLEKKTSIPVGLVRAENPNYREADPHQWLRAMKEAYREVTADRSIHLEALAVSGNGPTLVSVDADGNPVGNAMSWMDRRGVAEAETIRQAAGYYVDPTFYLPKALWVRKNRQEDFKRIVRFLACPEFIIHYLSGEAHTILPGDSFLRYFWTDELLESLGFRRELFPDFIDPGTPCGTVTAAASAETGIPAGTPVIAGGPDFVMSLLGTASVYPGRACDRAGTSEGINLCTASLVEDERLMGYGHVVKGLYNLSGIISTSGKALEWVIDLLGQQNADYEDIFKRAAQSPPGARGLVFLPYLTGERAPHWDPLLRGSFFGLALFHGPEDIIRAVLESTGYAMRDVIEVIEGKGLRIDDLRITGNPSRSPLWNRIKADITGKPIKVPEFPESELLGDACVALRGLGLYKNLQQAAENIVRFKDVIEPDPDRAEGYGRMFRLYRELYSQTKSIAHELTDLQKMEEA